MANATTSRARVESFVWTDDEVELLLRITLDYKSTKLQENVNWESCQSKYSDIADAFQAQYPRELTEKDFPHGMVSKAQVTAKLKNIRNKYKHAVDTGRRRSQGRVVLIFYDLCEEIWGGSRATRSIDTGIDTGDLEESSTSTVEMPSYSPNSTESLDCLPSLDVKQRRDLLQLNSHRGDRLKRKVPTDPAEEDLKIKRRMLELIEDSSRRNSNNMLQINTNIANITTTIQEGFSLMREMFQRQFTPPNDRKLTDRPEDEPSPTLTSDAQIDNPLGNQILLPSQIKRESEQSDESGKTREEIEQKLMQQDVKMEEDSKHMSELEAANRSLQRELDEVKNNLKETENNLRASDQQKGSYEQQLHSTVSSLDTIMKELQGVLANGEPSEDGDQKTQANGSDE